MPMSPSAPAPAEEARPPHAERPVAAPPTCTSSRPRRRLGRAARLSVLVVALAAVGAGCEYDVFGGAVKPTSGIARGGRGSCTDGRGTVRRRAPRHAASGALARGRAL